MSPVPFHRREGGFRWNPLMPERATPSAPMYRDGCCIISEAGESATWAVCHQGCWGIVYECEGRQVLSAWVSVSVLPLHVLVEAMAGEPR